MATSIATARVELTPRELAIRKMMDACDRDPKLQQELLKAPKEFAQKHGVTLEVDEEKQLKNLAQLLTVIDQFTAGRIHGPGPIFYPADVWWKRALANHVINYEPLFNKLFPPKGYPIGPLVNVASDLQGRISLVREE